MQTFFLGISVTRALSSEDLIELKYLNLATIKHENTWYIYSPLKIIHTERAELSPEEMKTISLKGAAYQHFLNQLKRVSDPIYNSYNNDFGLKSL
jgi:hypothetical protein